MIEAAYGSWASPLSSKLACDSSISIKRLYVDAQSPDIVYWSELHPQESGKTIVFSKHVNETKSAPTRWTNGAFNVADSVHEYGGAAYCVNNGTLYFMNYSVKEDNKIYSQASPEASPVAVTHKDTVFRYADPDFSTSPKFFFCVREDHSDEKAECTNLIICVNVSNGEETVVASGNNFYSFPRVSPDGKRIAWMEWSHPNMPWDDTQLWVADVSYGESKVEVTNKRQVAGEPNVNFMEPQWNCDNNLMYICDKTGWWNLYLHDLQSSNPRNIYEKAEEIGSPCWNFGDRSYSPHPTNKDLVAVIYDHKPYILTTSTGKRELIDVGGASISSCVFQPSKGKYLYMHAVNSIEPQCILQYDLDNQKLRVLHKSAECPVDAAYLSVPTKETFAVADGVDAYGYYYPPKNADYKAPAGTLPPLLIKIHGGPTGAASLGMDLLKQYFTSRGFAVFDVDYRGSTSYGTKFRKSLRGNWGVYDIQDTIAAAMHLVNDGRVDGKKLCISGGSAGGYTTLADLTFDKNIPKTFAAGASYYGVSKMSALAEDTHKFESRYCDMMIAEYPEQKQIYEDRSPYNYPEDFRTPCAFFQGKLDKVVPPDQSKDMFDVLNNAGVPCAYILFKDEGHGFDISENKQTSLDGEFYFYSQILGFEPADKGIEIPIHNLPKK